MYKRVEKWIQNRNFKSRPAVRYFDVYEHGIQILKLNFKNGDFAPYCT